MFNPRLHGRRTVRCQGYNYTGCGYYFVTVCASQRRDVFGCIGNDACIPNGHGRVIIKTWLETVSMRGDVMLDEWVLMPDHFHALIWLEGETTTSTAAFGHRVPGSLGAIVGGWKSRVTSLIWQQRELRGWPQIPIWQRGYYDHIVRDEHELTLIRRYIWENPLRVQHDEYFD